jgi:hypothetical protein
MTNEEFLRDVCPNHTESSKWNKSELLHILELHKEQLRIGGVSNCNGLKDPNIVKTYALITRKDGLTDVWCEGECLGKGLDTDGINKLNL